MVRRSSFTMVFQHQSHRGHKQMLSRSQLTNKSLMRLFSGVERFNFSTLESYLMPAVINPGALLHLHNSHLTFSNIFQLHCYEYRTTATRQCCQYGLNFYLISFTSQFLKSLTSLKIIKCMIIIKSNLKKQFAF